ncbi:MAG TPA: hypothetical protein VNN09_13510, partial [Candidatus Competibacteraceae bacterium]|nr:hypothetical protein [Candidatus Competibacteraceae bacterium]
QVRLALGKDLERVQALFLMATAPGTEQLGWLAREHPELTSGVADAATRAFFRDAFPNGAAEGEWIYLIDPLGNLFMRYPAAMRAEREAKGLLEDLRHLLKYSKLG